MSEPIRLHRTCPACGGGEYTFRGRKQIEATAEQGPMLETKFLGGGCGKAWKEREPGTLPKAPPRPK